MSEGLLGTQNVHLLPSRVGINRGKVRNLNFCLHVVVTRQCLNSNLVDSPGNYAM